MFVINLEVLMEVFFSFSEGSSYARSSVVTAVKFTISDHPQTIDPLLKNCIGKCYDQLVFSMGNTYFLLLLLSTNLHHFEFCPEHILELVLIVIF